MTAIQNKSWEAAISEGLAYFWAHMHVGHSVSFVGHTWEEAGFSTDEDGNPIRDVKGNTVAQHRIDKLNAAIPSHLAQVQEWYGA